MAYDPSPKTEHYDFFGPVGAFAVSAGIPLLAYWLVYLLDPVGFGFTPAHFLDARAFGLYFGFYLWVYLCWAILPGRYAKGVILRDGESQLVYKMNALAQFVATFAAVGVATAVYGPGPLLYVAQHIPQLVTAALVMSVAQATFVYLWSFRPGTMLAVGGNSGNTLYDWFIGRGLNPRLAADALFDFKCFNELYPGLTLWCVVDVAMIAQQIATTGHATDSILLVTAFHAWYVVDSYWNEASVLTTMDITSDGFGFMLAMGDLLHVPFTYSYTAQYLARNPVRLGPVRCAAIVALNFLGYYVFRASNSEKNAFRKGQNPQQRTFLQTKRGTKLLTSGWWGISQHPNYLGDWIMALSWCLPGGFASPLPYFYFFYFVGLLVHRQIRDDEACKLKYGDDWEVYKKLVPYKIIPYVY